MPTTFPIEDNTVRIDFVDFSDELLVSVIGKFLTESVIDGIDGVCWALVDKDFGTFFGLLLDRGKESIVGSRLWEGDNDGDGLFLCIVGLDV